MQNIMNCPGCNSSNVITERDVTSHRVSKSDTPEYYVVCLDCFMSGPVSICEHEAIILWNTLPRDPITKRYFFISGRNDSSHKSKIFMSFFQKE